MRGYLKLIKGVPTIVRPNGDFILDFTPPEKYMNHIVNYDKSTKTLTLDGKYGNQVEKTIEI